MQRAPCWRSRLSSMWKWNSRQSWMRSSGVRSTGSSRKYSINPVGLPMMKLNSQHTREVARVFFERSHDGFLTRQTLIVCLLDAGQHALIVPGHYFHELRDADVPGVQDAPCTPAARVLPMPFNQIAQLGAVRRVIDTGDGDHLLVDVIAAVAGFIQHIGDTAGHAGGEVAAGGPQHHDATTGH